MATCASVNCSKAPSLDIIDTGARIVKRVCTDCYAWLNILQDIGAPSDALLLVGGPGLGDCYVPGEEKVTK